MSTATHRAFLALAFAIAPLSLNGQTSAAQLTGRITDSSGSVIPNTSVVATNVNTGVDRQAVSNEAGYYSLPSLNPGEYRVTAQAEGFKATTRTGIILEVNQTARIDIEMSLGAVTESVQVVANAPLVNSDTAELGALVENQSLVDLPLNARNPYTLALLVPGVQTSGPNLESSLGNHATASQMVISGGRTKSSEYLVDGHPATANWSEVHSSVAGLPSVDAVQEFKVQTNAFPAEFGRSSGGILNAVTKSGTNEFRGTVYEFLRNSKLDANSFFSNRSGTPLASFKRNQFGANLGGPIVRNTAFFFFNYEGLQERAASTMTATVPTPAQLQGDFSQTFRRVGAACSPLLLFDPVTTRAVPGGGFVRDAFSGNRIPASRTDPVARKLLTLYPAPNQPGDACTGANNFFSVGSNNVGLHLINVRGDWTISTKDQITAGVTWRTHTTIPYDHYRTAGSTNMGSTKDPSGTFRLGYTRVQSSNLVIELRSNVNRAHRDQRPVAYLGLSELGFPKALEAQAQSPQSAPKLNVTGYGGIGVNYPFVLLTGTNYGWAGSATWLKGGHTVKFGIDARVLQSREWTGFYTHGQYNFNRNFTQGPDPNRARADIGDGLATMLLGLGDGTIQNIPDILSSSHYYGLYVQDSIKVTPKLTVSLGLRYDYESPRQERFDQLSWLDIDARSPLSDKVPGFGELRGGLRFVGVDADTQFDPDRNNFGPRVSIAYRLTEKTTIRSGYGVLYPPYVGGASGAGAGFAGFQTATPWVSSLDGLTPLNYLSNPFPNGLEVPPGSSQGLLTLVGTGIGTTNRDGTFLRNARASYFQQWNFNVQRELPGGVAVELAYAGSKGTKLGYGPLGEELNQLTPEHMKLGSALQQLVPNPFYGVITTRGPLSQPTVTRGQLLRPYPHFLELLNFRPTAGNSMYNSFQARVQKRFSNSLGFLVSYTNAKAITDSDSITGFDGNAPGTQNAYDRRADRSLAGTDLSQRLVFSVLYELPFGRGLALGRQMPRWLDLAVGNWQLNAITTFQSGFPLALTAPNTSGAFARGMRPNVVGDPELPGGRSTTDKLAKWFDTEAFAQPAPFTFGNAPRTLPSVRDHGTRNIDLSLFKKFPIGEKRHFEFRAEAFNAMNRPQFGSPGTTLGGANFGVVASQRNIPRQIQFGAKIYF